ncbi:unnamed protein product [Amoebophrya sp. A120]|nr:unnamed protein product [Amoebophrya sp. A120]|eukprot:GSA120T00018246001.1
MPRAREQITNKKSKRGETKMTPSPPPDSDGALYLFEKSQNHKGETDRDAVGSVWRRLLKRFDQTEIRESILDAPDNKDEEQHHGDYNLQKLQERGREEEVQIQKVGNINKNSAGFGFQPTSHRSVENRKNVHRPLEDNSDAPKMKNRPQQVEENDDDYSDNPYLIKPHQLPLSTRGRAILDAEGNPVRLRCANWSGAQLEKFSVGGLNVQRLDTIVLAIRKLHFNCVRLVYSLDLVFETMEVPDAQDAFRANPELLANETGGTPRPTPSTLGTTARNDHVKINRKDHKNAGEEYYHLLNTGKGGAAPFVAHPYKKLLHLVVEQLRKRSLLVILNNHMSDAGWCCNALDGNGLWYTRSYPERDWLAHLSLVAKDFRENPYVVGIDLRNEIRASSVVNRLPQWYSSDPAVDWGSAALRGGIAVQKENPHLLVIVGGVWYNMFLCDVPKLPIHEFLPNKIVYTAHAYSWFSNRLQVAKVLRYYSASLVSLLLLTWVLVAVAAVVQRYYPQASLTRFVAERLQRLANRFARSRRKRESRRRSRAVARGRQSEADIARRPPVAASTRLQEDVDQDESETTDGTSQLPSTPEDSSARRSSSRGELQPRRSSLERRLSRLRENTSFAFQLIRDPMYLWAIVSLGFIPLFALATKKLSGGCNITYQVVGVVCVVLATLFGVVSLVLWFLIVLRYLLTSEDVQHRFLSLCTSSTTGTGSRSDGARQEDAGPPPVDEQEGRRRRTRGLSQMDAEVEQAIEDDFEQQRSSAEDQEDTATGSFTIKSSNQNRQDTSSFVSTPSVTTISSSGSSEALSSTPSYLLSPRTPAVAQPVSVRTSASLMEEINPAARDAAIATATTSSLGAPEQQRNQERELISPEEALRLVTTPIRSRVSVVAAIFVTAIVLVFSHIEQQLQSYGDLRDEYDQNWGYLVKEDIAPVWVGEFGIGADDAANPWFEHVLKYFEERGLSWSYWPIDGQEKLNASEPFGILKQDYTRIRDVFKMQKLAPLLNLTTNETTGDTYPPDFGPWSYPPGFGPDGPIAEL